jgi:superfamily I DNA and/or RNA helicase
LELKVEKIKQLFKKQKWDGITVGSVEEFQGQERLVIIITTVRSTMELLKEDYKVHLGFLRNPKVWLLMCFTVYL